MIKILAIGDSFLQDATAYLHQMAELDDREIKIALLLAGSGSLEGHWLNIIGDRAAYDCKVTGLTQANEKTSIYEALNGEDWDFIVMQQTVAYGGIDTSFYPYIKNLSAYVKKFAPKAAQYLHQTWAYETGCGLPDFGRYNNDQRTMYRAVVSAYQNAARNIKAKIIPCGEIIQRLRALEGFDAESGGQALCGEDGAIEPVYGSYALSAVWYELLAGGNILESSFIPPSQDGVDKRLINIIKQTVHETIKR